MEILASKKIEAREETSRLQTVLAWGAPGPETVLAQLLPKEISCFEEHFNVPEAVKEFDNARKILEEQGVEVVIVKDLLASLVKKQDLNISLPSLIDRVTHLAVEFADEHGVDHNIKEEVVSWIKPLIEADVEKYGEKQAILINQALSLEPVLPLANILYARDQSNLLGNVMIWSSMRHPIRQPEVSIIKHTLNQSDIFDGNNVVQIQVQGEGRFEGGDAIVHNGICYIGVGGRTNMEGVNQIARPILSSGLRVIAVYDKLRDLGGEGEMDAMHLDTFWMPVNSGNVVACMDEVRRRDLIEFRLDADNILETTNLGKFDKFMESNEIGVIGLTKEEQLRYAPNFLNLGDGRVVLSLANGNNLTKELTDKGITVLNADLQNITKGYGGLHCMTGALRRI